MSADPGGPQPRPDLAGLPAYVAGRSVSAVAGRTFKLSSNEAADPPEPEVVAAIARAAASANRYPDAAGRPLAERIAAGLDLAPEQVVVTGGSLVALQQLLEAFAGAGTEVVHAWRSYEAYPILVQVSGATAVPVPLRDQCHDLDAMADAITPRTRVVIVCTPNNPTGTSVSAATFERFLARVPADVAVVLDEAYREFDTGAQRVDGVRAVLRHPNVVSLRTFSKAHSLAGARVGYAIGSREVLDAARAVALPFTLSALAEAAGLAALDVWYRREPQVLAVAAARDELRDALLGLGYEVPQSQGNFVWLPLGERSTAFTDAAAAAGVAVRCFAGSGVRVTVGEAAGLERLLAVAAAFPQH